MYVRTDNYIIFVMFHALSVEIFQFFIILECCILYSCGNDQKQIRGGNSVRQGIGRAYIGRVQAGYRQGIGRVQVGYRQDIHRQGIGRVQVGYRQGIGRVQAGYRQGIHRQGLGRTQAGFRQGIGRVRGEKFKSQKKIFKNKCCVNNKYPSLNIKDETFK